MIVDDPVVLAEVTAASDRYEAALQANDLGTLDELFWDDARVERVSQGNELVGIATIRAFRAGRPVAGLARDRLARRIVCFGADTAVVNLVFRRHADGRIGRQSQTWVRLPQGWRIVFAHISDRT